MATIAGLTSRAWSVRLLGHPSLVSMAGRIVQAIGQASNPYGSADLMRGGRWPSWRSGVLLSVDDGLIWGANP